VDLNEDHSKLVQMKHVLTMYRFSGINRKAQIKPTKWEVNDEGLEVATAGTLVLKWGGELTETGKQQAEQAGRVFREALYDRESTGLLRLHATYQHDLKIYSSDEGRVQMTAAAFSKGFLDLEGELPPILVGLVRKDGINALLDETESAERDLQSAKDKLYPLLNANQELTDEIRAILNPDQNENFAEFLLTVTNFRELLREVYCQVKAIKKDIKQMMTVWEASGEGPALYQGETPSLFYARWKKVLEDFYNKKKDTYDISKIPDLYDNIKYDALHNVPPLNKEAVWRVHGTMQSLASFVVASEYGMERTEKRQIGRKICCSLIKKIAWDLQTAAGLLNTEDDDDSSTKAHRTLHRLSSEELGLKNSKIIRSRLYFTSESHILGLLNTLRHGLVGEGQSAVITEEAEAQLQQLQEANFLTTITFRLFEDTLSMAAETDPARFLVELCFSPGVDPNLPDSGVCGEEVSAVSLPLIPLFQMNDAGLDLQQLVGFFCSQVPAVTTPSYSQVPADKSPELLAFSPSPSKPLSPLTGLSAVRTSSMDAGWQ